MDNKCKHNRDAMHFREYVKMFGLRVELGRCNECQTVLFWYEGYMPMDYEELKSGNYEI